MPLVDSTVENKSSEDVSDQDIREILNAPDEYEQALVEPDLFQEEQPHQPVYKSIPLKAAVAAVAALVLLTPVMLMFSGNLLSRQSDSDNIASETEEALEGTDPDALTRSEEENAQLKKTLALQSQSFTATDLDDAAAAEGATQGQEIPSPSATPTPRPTPATRPASAITSRPSIRASPPPRPLAITQPAPVSRATPSFATAPSRPVNIDQIANAGNYGELPSQTLPVSAQPVAFGNQSNTGSLVMASANGFPAASSGSIPVSVGRSSIPVDSIKAVDASSSRPLRPKPRVMQDIALTVAAIPTQGSQSPGSAIDIAGSLGEANTIYRAERDLIMGDALQANDTPSYIPLSILPGSTALAQVSTAITWASDLPQTQGSITLTSPLVSDSFEVLPEATQLIVQVGALSESGAVALEVVGLVLPGSSDITEINIPSGALEILAVDGGYPVARAEQSSERQLRAIDRQQAILGAASGAGRFLNRPESESSIFGIGGSSTTREYGSGSLVGSLLSGAADQMLRSRSNRLEEKAEQLMDRPTIWSLEMGRELQLFITEEIAL